MEQLLIIISMLAIIQYVIFGALVGRSRGKYNVAAPATSGHEIFERYNRVHQNTLEQLVVLLPGLWAFGFTINEYLAAGLGIVYLIGRVIYLNAYVKDPVGRGLGMIITVIPSYILVLGGLVGAVLMLTGK
ncbi:MAPEG family protein [Pseudomonadota bacterium]